MTSNLGREVLHAIRSLRRSPAFTVTVVIILGVAIGMTTAVMGVFDAVIRRPLPVTDQDRLVMLWTENKALAVGQREIPFQHAQFQRFRAATRTLTDVAGVINYGAIRQPVTIGDQSVLLNYARVAGDYFRVLGTTPAMGRFLQPEDDVPGATPVIVLNYDTWQRVFAGAPDVVGRQVGRVWDGGFHTVIGVAPPGLGYPAGVDFWSPLGPQPGTLVYVVGRLARGATPGAARDELDAFIRAEAASGVDKLGEGESSVVVYQFREVVVGSVRAAVIALVAGAVLLLVIGCASIGNLLLVRGAGRGRELAIRRAVGASYGQVVRQLLIESVLLAALGGALGLFVAFAFLQGLLALAPPGFPRLDVLGSGGLPWLIALGVTAAAALLFGLGPAITSARVNLAAPLRVGAGVGTELRARRVKQFLVVAQVAIALVVLAGAGVVVRSLARLSRLDMGFQVDRLAVLEVAFSWKDYGAKLVALQEDVLTRMQAVPGVIAATPVLLNPFNGVGGWDVHFKVEGKAPPPKEADHPYINMDVAGPDYFRVFDIPIRRGRSFTGADRKGSVDVIIVSEGVARQFWPGEDPLGKRLELLGGPGVAAQPGWRTVVGVVGETRYRDLLHPLPTVYFPYQQAVAFGHFAIRTHGPLSAVAGSLRRAVQAIGAGVNLVNARSMDAALAEPLGRPRLNAVLLSLFGAVALLLAVIGLYGTLAFVVRQRTKELAIRVALGATARQVRARVLKEALAMVGTGLGIGLLASLVGLRVLKNLVYDVSPTDPLVLAVVCVVLTAATAVAAYLPARRATRVDPMMVLRTD